MKRRKKNVLDDSDEESNDGSQSPDSDNAVNGSRTVTQKKATARKRGRPPKGTKKKAQKLQDDSDDGGSTRSNTPHNASDSESGNEDNSDSDSAVNGSRTVTKQKATARKRGRPPKGTKKKAQKLQDDSEDGGSTRSNTPHNASDNESGNEDNSDSDCTTSNSRIATKKKATARKRGRPPKVIKKTAQRLQDDSDDGGSTRPNTPQNANNVLSESSNSSDSDCIANSVSSPKRRLGRPSPTFINKKRRLQNGTLRDPSPQPSTSQNGIDHSAEESESDSDSNSADSDFGPVNERSLVKKKPVVQRPPPKATNSRVAKKKFNYSASGSNSSRSAVNSSQLNTSQKKGTKLSQTQDALIDSKEVESLAQKLVYFLLIEDQKKYAIRKRSIQNHIFKDGHSPKLYGPVIKKANIFLKKIYGMELMELENQKDSYLIVNILRRELGIHDYVDLPRIKQQQHGLILFLLAVIFMNENVISEDELTKCLKPLGIDLTSKRMHPVFGDVKKYITTELVKQMYISYSCVSKDPPKYEFTWGLRAKQEFDKRDLLQFVCTVMEDTVPEDWRIQFRDAEASAKPNTES